MCLTVKRIRHLNGKPKIAKRNIPCFKVLYMHTSGRLCTPFQNTPVKRDSIESGLYADSLDFMINGEIYHGIHSYKDARKAFGTTIYCDCIVCAYIPKGTKYWIGKGGVYVSECIKFNNLNPNK